MQKTFANLELNGQAVDITVADGRIASIAPAADGGAATRPVGPAFYNCHTHLAMNLLRGYADDLELMPWLQEHIWPAEAHLTDEIVYAGTRLAILELIRSGTVFANDMYWYAPAVLRAGRRDLPLVTRSSTPAAFTRESRTMERYQENLARLKSGNLYEVAGVIKSLMHRDVVRGLSTGERKMLANAKQILISEIVVATGMEHGSIEARLCGMIDEELGQG